MTYKLPDEAIRFFQDTGRRGGKKLLRERGTEYFKRIRKLQTDRRQKKQTVDK